MSVKKLACVLLGAIVMLASGTACGSESKSQAETSSSRTNSSTSSAARTSSSDGEISSQSGGEKEMTVDNVKLLGRTYAASDGTIWMGLSGTGAELIYTGSKLSVTMRGNQSSEDKAARVGIFVDCQLEKDLCLTGAEQTVDIDGKGDTPINVRIIKLSECSSSCCAITAIEAHGGKIEKAASKQRRIEFIGDSITCGYGVDDPDLSHGFSTSTEDCTKAYAYKTAMGLDAEYSLVSFSGYGIVSGYTGDGYKNTDGLVPKYYESYGFTENSGFDGKNPSEIAWDFSAFKPDVIVIYLGTNDSSYTGYDEDRQKEYTADYVEFLKKVRSVNAQAKIICTLGTMGNALNGAMNEAVSQYSAQTGDKNISTLDLPLQDIAADGCTINGHPSVTTYDKVAALISEKIQTETGWN